MFEYESKTLKTNEKKKIFLIPLANEKTREKQEKFYIELWID
jgi:hypothetical protein